MLWGLVLSMLTGPILLVLVQTGIEKGIRAGVAVGTGVWVSDLLFIGISFLGVALVHDLADHPWFEYILGTFGGIMLIGFGIGTMVVTPRMEFESIEPQNGLDSNNDQTVYSKYSRPFVKGFLINTINPFTIFFWTGIVAKLFVGKGWDDQGVLICLLTILITIILTDTAKVVGAKKLRKLINGRQLLILRKISGIALIVFGLVLLYRVW